MKSFLIRSRSLFSLHVTHNVKYDHPVLIRIHEVHLDLIPVEKGIVFVSVPGQVGVRAIRG